MAGGRNRTHLCFDVMHLFEAREEVDASQGCINCGILVSRIPALGVSSEHMENMEMFSCSPT